jgi:ribulose-5-phosphate 4-epimerase/fuculose-1-phosphate aldolase
MSESRLREDIAAFGELLTGLGLAHGSTGNISVRLDDGWLITPTNSRLGRLDPARIARLDQDGRLVSGDKPSKEAFLHRCVYDMRPTAGAIVHLHSTHSVAVSCLAGIDADDVLPPLTAYYVMRVGKLPLVPYFPRATSGSRARCDRSRPGTRRCCSPIMGRSSRARAWMRRSARSRSSRRRPGCISCCTVGRPGRSMPIRSAS